jgi:hypothetical protein
MSGTTDAGRVEERARDLVRLAIPPAVWALHFVACYVTAAVWCARYAGYGGQLAPITGPIAIYTAGALTAIVAVGWEGYRRHRHGAGAPPHDVDSAEDRHRFLGFATFLLAALGGIATLFVAYAALTFAVCV